MKVITLWSNALSTSSKVETSDEQGLCHHGCAFA
jgi:hypothetical protein